jgi:hypothetical protein
MAMTIIDFHIRRIAAIRPRLVAGICAAVLATGASAGAESPVDSAVRHPDRSEADIARDKGRKPADVLAFFEVRQGMRVIEIGSGGGYYSELLSRVVGDDGFVYAHNPYVFLKLAATSRRVCRVGYHHGGGLNRWVPREIGADELTVPFPLVLGVRRGMNAHEAATSSYVPLECRLLGGVQHVTGGAQEDDRTEIIQPVIPELAWILRMLDREAMLLS